MVVYRVDKEKNLLFIGITGVVPKVKMMEYIEEFVAKCSEFKGAFSIINDMSLLKISSEHDLERLCKITSMMKEKFVITRIIRIIGENTVYEKKLKEADAAHKLDQIFYVATKKCAFDMLLNSK